MDGASTYDVRVYRIEIYRGARVTTYNVRWNTGSRLWKQPFRNAAQADSYRSSLLTAARKGEAFSIETGRPVSWNRTEPSTTWYDLALAYCAAKWPYASPNYRGSIAEALIDATEVMLTSQSPWPDGAMRNALRSWAFSDRMRGQAE